MLKREIQGFFATKRLCFVILFKGYRIKDYIIKYKNKLLTQYINLALFFSIALAPLYYYLENMVLALLINAFSVVSFYLFRIRHDESRYPQKSRIFLVAITLLFVIGFAHETQELNSNFFLLLFPIVSFSLRGAKEGIAWASILLVLLIGSFFYFQNYNGYSFFFFCCSYFILSYLLYYYRYYERKISEHMFAVQQQKNALEKENERLNTLATTDKLTSIYNRAKLESLLQECFFKAQTEHEVFSIILLDLDYFKMVNDTFGHQVGDVVLQESALVLTREIDKDCFLGRWGGEEFMVICPDTTHHEAYLLAKSLKESISNYTFTEVGHKTASLGVTSYTKKTPTVEAMIHRADKALYEAKASGRNLVKMHQGDL